VTFKVTQWFGANNHRPDAIVHQTANVADQAGKWHHKELKTDLDGYPAALILIVSSTPQALSC